jgi:hypothetical protein
MAAKTKKTDENSHTEFQWPFGKKNYIIFAIALIVIILGYVTLGKGSITLAPLLLVIGYCILVPIALLVKDPAVHNNNAEAEQTEE